MAKKGDKYKCNECGVVMVVEDPCSCSPCDLICCGVPMEQVGKQEKPTTKPKAKK